jgi:hypothetical protein
MRHQCELLDLCRSSYYYQCCPETEENLALMRRLDELHLEHPVYGTRRLAVSLRREGLVINRKRVVRLLRLMGIAAIYAKPKTSLPAPGHQIYPYLLRNLVVTGPDQVWCADITYVPMSRGFMYLVAVMDWWSRYVLGWRLSNTLEAAFCVDAWQERTRRWRKPWAGILILYRVVTHSSSQLISNRRFENPTKYFQWRAFSGSVPTIILQQQPLRNLPGACSAVWGQAICLAVRYHQNI